MKELLKVKLQIESYMKRAELELDLAQRQWNDNGSKTDCPHLHSVHYYQGRLHAYKMSHSALEIAFICKGGTE